MTDRSGKELIYKDLLMISNGNYLEAGIYKRGGSVNNLNYYQISYYNLRCLKGEEIHWKTKNSTKISCAYINTDRNNRYIKISEDQLKDDEKVIYNEMIKLL